MENLLILTGFGPFGSIERNLSGELVKLFPKTLNDIDIYTGILPVSWKKSIEEYNLLIQPKKDNIELALLLGVHQKNSISLEKRALNWTFGWDIDNDYKRGWSVGKWPLCNW